METPNVRAQPDGVHVTIDNRLGFDTGFSARYENGAGGGDDAPRGESNHVLPAPPGTLEVGCYTDRNASGSDLEAVEVLDPSGTYRSTELDCDASVQGISDYAEGATGFVGELIDIARVRLEQATELRGDDVVEFAGYPDDHLHTVRLVRDDRVVATVTFYASGQGGWLEDTFSRCDELVG